MKKFISIVFLVFISISSISFAATLTVTTATDELDSTATSTGCSLREAIQNINDYTASGSITYTDCGTPDGDSDTIVLDPEAEYTITLTESSEEDNNQTGDFDIKGNVILTTNSEYNTSISGDSTYRIFDIIDSGLTVSFERILFQGGKHNENGACMQVGQNQTVSLSNFYMFMCSLTGSSLTHGGGIYIGNGSTVNLSHGSIFASAATASGSNDAKGGAIYANNATVTIDDFVFEADNIASNSSTGSAYGGGIYLTSGSLTVTNSYFGSQESSSAACALGGAIYATNSAAVDVQNSTFYSNTTESTLTGVSMAWCAGGAAIAAENSSLKINHSTLVENTTQSNFAAGLNIGAIGITSSASDTIQIKNSIVFTNTTNSGKAGNISGNMTSYGYNVIESQESGTTSYAAGIDSSFDTNVDPNLSSLTGVAEQIQYLPITAGSSAEDAGSCFDIDGNAVTTDVRGYLRDDGDSTCDIGAYELVENESGDMCSDGIDNDDDGQTDCDDSDCDCSTWYVDSDSDGYGVSSDLNLISYAQPDGYVSNTNDCNDSSSLAHPGLSSEDSSCNDGLDNDCDGLIDTADSECVEIEAEPVETTTDSDVTSTGSESADPTVEPETTAAATSTSSSCSLKPAQSKPNQTVGLLIFALIAVLALRRTTVKSVL